MNWFYVDGPQRVGPLTENEWAELVRSGKIQADTLVWHEGLPNWTAYSQIQPPVLPKEASVTELEEESGERQDHLPDESLDAFVARVQDREYTVNVGSCLARGWHLLKSHFWMLVGSTFLITAITLIGVQTPVLEWVFGMALQGVLVGGLFNVYFRLMRGEPAVTADLFSGFDPSVFRQLVLKTFVTFVVMDLLFVPAIIASKMTGITPENLEMKMGVDSQSVLVCLLVVFTCCIPAIYFSFCWMFALPLIVDKRMAFWPAMQLSRHKVLQHPWRVSLLAIAAGIVGSAGAVLLGIGIVFTIPIYFAATLYLYEDIFGNGDESVTQSPEPAPDQE